MAPLVRAEESFFCQRSRVTWLMEGDSNTSYFYRMADTRKSINTIHFVYDSQGTNIESQHGIRNHCVYYFANLLGSAVTPPMHEQSEMNLLLSFRCSQNQIGELELLFSDRETKEPFFSLPRNKTCGPDGYSGEFFHYKKT